MDNLLEELICTVCRSIRLFCWFSIPMLFLGEFATAMTSRLFPDIFSKDTTQLLKTVLDSLRDLIAAKNIDLYPEISSKCSPISKTGSEQIKSRALLIPLSKDGSCRDQSSIARMIYRNCDIGSGEWFFIDSLRITLDYLNFDWMKMFISLQNNCY